MLNLTRCQIPPPTYHDPVIHFTASRVADADSPAEALLPDGATRPDLLDLVHYAGREAGLRKSSRDLLQWLVYRTAPDDWTVPGRTPIVYMAQAEIAAKRDLTPRAIRYAERELLDQGWIAKCCRNDGGRGVRRMQGGRVLYGLSLAPVAAKWPVLQDAARRREEHDRDLVRLRSRLGERKSMLRSEMRLHHEDPDLASALHQASAVLEALPARITRVASASVLASHLRDAERAWTALRNAVMELAEEPGEPERAAPVDPDPTPNTNPPTRSEFGNSAEIFSSAADGFFRRQLQYDSTVETNNYHRTGVLQARPWQAAGSGGPGRSRDAGPDPALHPDPLDLYRAATDDAQLLIDDAAARRPTGSLQAYADAASVVGVGLGISDGLWHSAVARLGQYAAAAAVLVIDRNRTHPTHRVRQPAAVLVEMLRRHTEGRLDLAAAVRAILARGPDQPRAVPAHALPYPSRQPPNPNAGRLKVRDTHEQARHDRLRRKALVAWNARFPAEAPARRPWTPPPEWEAAHHDVLMDERKAALQRLEAAARGRAASRRLK